jgi:anti-sigma-K factor RskA
MTCAEFATHVEDYVTGALDPEERAAIETHASACPTCGPVLRELQEAATRVWLALPQVDPPPRLRARILKATHAQTPVAVTPARRPRLSLAAIAAALSLLSLIAALGLGGWALALQNELNRLSSQNARLTSQLAWQRDALYVLMSPTRQERQLAGSEAAPEARGLVYLDPSRSQGMVIASHLPPLTADKSYQIWLRGQGGIVSAGLLRVDEHGTGYAILEPAGTFSQFETIGISLEPAGGSPQPTGPRMLGGGL